MSEVSVKVIFLYYLLLYIISYLVIIIDLSKLKFVDYIIIIVTSKYLLVLAVLNIIFIKFDFLLYTNHKQRQRIVRRHKFWQPMSEMTPIKVIVIMLLLLLIIIIQNFYFSRSFSSY